MAGATEAGERGCGGLVRTHEALFHIPRRPATSVGVATVGMANSAVGTSLAAVGHAVLKDTSDRLGGGGCCGGAKGDVPGVTVAEARVAKAREASDSRGGTSGGAIGDGAIGNGAIGGGAIRGGAVGGSAVGGIAVGGGACS